MKICFLGNGESPNIQYRVECFAKKHDVSLISFHGFKEGYSPDVDTYHLPMPLHKDISLSKAPKKYIQYKKTIKIIKNILDDIQPDVLHSFYITHYGFLGASCDFHPFGISTLGSDLGRFKKQPFMYKYMIKYALDNLDIIHVQDPLSKKKVLDLGVDEDKIFVNPWGIDTNIYQPSKESKEYDIIRVRLFRKYINEHTFAEGIMKVIDEHPDLKVLSLGSGKCEGDFIRLAKKLGIFDNIQFEGWVDQSKIKEYLQMSKIFIDPIHFKKDYFGAGYGVALHQAMACGVPTIVAERPTICQLEGEDKWYHGYVYKGDDSQDLADKLLGLLDDKEKRDKISKKNLKSIEKRFDLDKNIEKIVDGYRKIL